MAVLSHRFGKGIMACVACIGCLGSTTSAPAELTAAVEIHDPTASFTGLHGPIVSHVQAALDYWGRWIDGSAHFETVVRFDGSISTATGRSLTSAFVENVDGLRIFEQGMASEIRTGIDPNGSTSDFEITFSPSYLLNTLWFDPDPFARTQPVGASRVDAVSVFLHEVGHGLAFNGWRNHSDGTLPGDFASPFDLLTLFDGSNFFFTGDEAQATYGGPVPLTFGNASHLGNHPPRPGDDLVPDLMNGVVFLREKRYEISRLDLAILADVGLTVLSPAAAIPGDANGDGIVDVTDLGILGINFNLANRTFETGDFNGDAVTDIADLGILGANWSENQEQGFHEALSAAGFAATAPEPNILGIVWPGLWIIASRHWQRSRPRSDNQ